MRGQFYIIASVFVLISLSVLFMFTLFVDFGSLTLPSQTTDFENLQNAISQQNTWLQTYWYNFNWLNKTTVYLPTGFVNPVQINAQIPSGQECYNSVYVFNKSGPTTFSYVKSNVSSVGGPCDVIFNATPGYYYVFWNCPSCTTAPPGRTDFSNVGVAPNTYTTTTAVKPSNICSHFAQLLPKKNIAFACSATALSNTYNYSVGFTATDFTYNGSIT